MKIATWNVNSIHKRMPLIIKFLQEEDIDVLCIQETKSDYSNFPVFDLKIAGYDALFVCEGGKNGVAILSRYKIELLSDKIECTDKELEKEARFISANILLQDKKFSLGCIYVPVGGFKDFNTLNFDDIEKWNKKLDFLRSLYKNLKKNQLDFLLGDFNIVSSVNDISDKEKVNFICCTEKERNIFSEFLKLGYDNIYNNLKPNKTAYSWWSYQFGHYSSNIGYRLDHILSKKNIFKYDDISIKNEPWRTVADSSDHAPILLDFDFI